jgi:hypothetical protein
VISKKKIREINNVSFIVEMLEPLDWCGRPRWWDSPPDFWLENERELWDVLTEVERKVKTEILRILGVKE